MIKSTWNWLRCFELFLCIVSANKKCYYKAVKNVKQRLSSSTPAPAVGWLNALIWLCYRDSITLALCLSFHMFLDSDFHLSDKWRGASCHLLRIRPPLGPNARLNSSIAPSVGQRLNSESFNWTLFLAFWIWSPRSQWTSLHWLTRNLFWAAVPTPPCSTSWRASMAKTKTTEASKCLLLFKSGWTTWSDPKQSLSERIISGRSALNYRAAYDYHHESVVFQSPKSELII